MGVALSRTRIVWTDHEQDVIFTASMALLKDKPRTKIHDAVRTAQIALPENRRRSHIVGPSQIPAPLLERFIINGALPKDWKKRGRSQAPQLVPIEQVDQLQAKIKTLEEEKQALEGQLATKDEEIGRYAAFVREVESRPTFIEAARDFIADTLAESIRRTRAVPGGAKDSAAADIMKGFFRAPQFVQPSKPQPPAPAAARPEPEPEKKVDPKTVVVVGIRHDEEQRLTKHFGARARLRYWRDQKLHTLEELAREADVVVINRASTGSAIVDACSRTGRLVQQVPTSGDRMVDAIEHYISHPEAYQHATQR